MVKSSSHPGNPGVELPYKNFLNENYQSTDDHRKECNTFNQSGGNDHV
jgi:hypothetical protein